MKLTGAENVFAIALDLQVKFWLSCTSVDYSQATFRKLQPETEQKWQYLKSYYRLISTGEQLQ